LPHAHGHVIAPRALLVARGGMYGGQKKADRLLTQRGS